MNRGLCAAGQRRADRGVDAAGTQPGAGLVPACAADRGWIIRAVSGLGRIQSLEGVLSGYRSASRRIPKPAARCDDECPQPRPLSLLEPGDRTVDHHGMAGKPGERPVHCAGLLCCDDRIESHRCAALRAGRPLRESGPQSDVRVLRAGTGRVWIVSIVAGDFCVR